jgi:hypothetical protein
MTTPDSFNLTLQNFARLLLGCDHKLIHKDLERLGYLFRDRKRWRITPKGAGLFHYRTYDEDHNPTVRANDLGYEAIDLHYQCGDLSMKPLVQYQSLGDPRWTTFEPGQVARLALLHPELLNSDDHDVVEAIKALNGTSDFPWDFHCEINDLARKLHLG